MSDDSIRCGLCGQVRDASADASAPCPACGCEVRSEPGRVVVRPTRETFRTRDWNGAEGLRAIEPGTTLAIEMGEVRYLDGGVIGLLLELKRMAVAAGGEFVLRNPRPDVREVLRITKIDRILRIE